jgi:gliding motility-associated-like protein
MKCRNILLLFLIFFGSKAIGQEMFHRSYPTNMLDNIHMLDGYATSAGNYFVLGAFLSEDLSTYDAYMLASFSNKGDVLWQKKLEGIPEAMIGTVSGRISVGANTGIHYSISFMNGMVPYRLIGNYDTGGQKVAHSTYAFNSIAVPGNVSIVDFKDNAFVQSGSFQTESTHSGLYLGKTDYQTGEFNWVKTLLGRDTLNNNFEFIGFHELSKSLIDSSLFVSGTGLIGGSTDESFPFIIKADSSGVLQWSRFYRTLSANNIRMSVLDHFETGDSSIVIAGAISSNTFTNGFIARLDSAGQVMWSKQVSQGADVVTLLDHVTVGANGIVASGKGLYTTIDTTYDFHLLINEIGEVINSAEYNALPGNFAFYGDIFSTGDGGSMYFTNQIEGEELVPVMVKTNKDLMTSCEDSLAGLIVTDLPLLADTLKWDEGLIDTVITEVEIFDTTIFSFNVPVLTLESVPFCPSEPIDHTFDPNVEGATSYLWSTGATSDTLRVMEEGDYSVTVTVGTKVCFTVCDTGRITQYERPEIEIGVNNGPFCETGQLGLVMQYIKDAPPAMIQWSTGENNVNEILIPSTGNYEVTVTDVCDEVATADIDINEFPKLISEVSVEVDDDFCDDNAITLVASADATLNSAFWSNGGAGQSTTVTEAGTYTVTVTDICNNSFEASATVTPDQIIDPIVALEIAPIGGDCVLESLELNASFSGEANTINWNTGSNDQIITVTAPGTYQVSVDNICGNTQTASIVIEECPECLTYPRVFFPQGMEELNKTFGPTLNCGDVITNYELKIFNRWGNLVFESNNVETEWNGTHGGDQAESGVYVYYAKYNAGAGEQMTEGDVTLIR